MNKKSNNDSEFLRHEPCPNCHSKDNLARYSDGGAYCFSNDCNYFEKGDGSVVVQEPVDHPHSKKFITDLEYESIRDIGSDTCKKFKYGIGYDKFNEKCHVANFYQNGKLIAQKLRKKGKKFSWIGNAKESGLFGQHLWHTGRKIVITEGEIDALSLSYCQDDKYPVVSITNGITNAVKELKKHYEYLMQFDEIILMFDNDDIAPPIAMECASLFPIGKAKIATLPLKDANEMLRANRGSEFISSIFRAKPYRPDGIILGSDTWELVSKEPESPVWNYPWKELDTMTHGVREGITTLCAGSGLGKSQICRELAYSLIMDNQPVGYIALEESVRISALGLMSLHCERRLHIDPITDEEQLKKVWKETLGDKQVYFYDHFGSTESDNLLNKVHYLVKGCGSKFIILDHLSIVVSDSEENSDERRLIDSLMTRLRKLVQELGIALFLVSHLKRKSNGKTHEQGAEPSLADLRGSHAIAQLSDYCIGFSRDSESDSAEKNHTKIKVLKNRFSGETGSCGVLVFDQETGRMKELVTDEDEHNEEEVPF